MVADRHHRDDLAGIQVERERPLDGDARGDARAALIDAFDFPREPGVMRVRPEEIGLPLIEHRPYVWRVDGE